MRNGLPTWIISALTCSMLFLAGCGGSSQTTGPIAATTLSGTAASGAPLLGIVTVKDADGVTRTTPILADGKYTIDVAGLKAPFKMKAEGKVGSTSVTCYSAALSTDVGGTINITPFTDLIIAQVAGDLAANYYLNADTSKLNAANLVTETARLRTALVNVLQSAGVSTSIDLLRASFNADSTGFDKVMDIVKVSVDPTSGVAQIKNILNNSTVSYDTAAPGTIGIITAPSVASLSDMDQIRLSTKGFFDLFATSIASFAQLQSLGLFDEVNFKHGGYDLNGFYSQDLNDPSIIGIRFTGVQIVSISATDASVEVGFALQGENHSFIWKFSKASGTWKTSGDQRIADVSIGAAANKDSFGGSGTIYSSGFNVDIQNPMNEAAYALVKGPGLPAAGLRLENQLTSDYFVVVTPGGGEDWYPLDDQTITSVFPVNSDTNISYTFELYAADNSLIVTYTEKLSKAPYTVAALSANPGSYFAALTTPATPAAFNSLVALLADGNVHTTSFAWSAPAALHTAEVSITLAGNGAQNIFRKSDPASNATSIALQNIDGSGAHFAVQTAEYRVHVRDAFGREFDSAMHTTLP